MHSIRLRVSQVESIAASGVTHITTGQIANYASLVFTYSGTLSNNMWLSLVSSSLDDNDPCSSGLEAATSPADAEHSGPKQASGREATVDTTPLSTSISFAVCYAAGTGGILDSTWSDTGVRVTVSKVSSVLYGEETGRTERRTTSGQYLAEDRFPQAYNHAHL